MAESRDKMNRKNFPKGRDGEYLVLDSRMPRGLRWRKGVDRLITDMSPQLSGDLDANDNSITGINNLTFTDTAGAVAGIQNQNLVDKSASETIAGAWTYGSNIAMDSNKITGLGNPTGAQDAATKSYVDSAAASAGNPGPKEIWLGKLDIATSSSTADGGNYWALDEVLHTTKSGESEAITFNDTTTGSNISCATGTYQTLMTMVQIHGSRKAGMDLYIDDANMIATVKVSGLASLMKFRHPAIFSVAASSTRTLAFWVDTGRMNWTATSDGEIYLKIERLV